MIIIIITYHLQQQNSGDFFAGRIQITPETTDDVDLKKSLIVLPSTCAS